MIAAPEGLMLMPIAPALTLLIAAAVALIVGGTFALLKLATLDTRLYESISSYFVANSVPGGYGQNIVNVILVDFRSLDTLGEIFVIGIAAVGVYAMLRFRAEDPR